MEKLELAWRTPTEWARDVLASPHELLSDHAYCELGAAASAQALIARHADDTALVERLSALAVEEMRHFRQVHRLLADAGGALGPPRKNPYAEGLVGAVDRGTDLALLDRLLVAALIERRSLERFELLAGEKGAPPRLKELYTELGPSEAGHARLFVRLASERFRSEEVSVRLAGWIDHEARLLQSLPFAARIHSGPPRAESGLEETARAVEERPGARASAAPAP